MTDAADERSASDSESPERLLRLALNTVGNAALGAAVAMAAAMLLLGLGDAEVPWTWSVAVAGALTAGFLLRTAADDVWGTRR